MDATQLSVRLDGIKECSRRTRVSFLVAIIVSMAIVISLYNSYLSWTRMLILDLADIAQKQESLPKDQQADMPKDYITKELQNRLVENWVKTNNVSAPVLGITVGSSDAAVLGSLSLVICSIWFFFCARRENHAVWGLLRDTNEGTLEERQTVLHGIMSHQVFTDTSRSDAALDDIQNRPSPTHYPVARFALQVLIFLPALVAVFIICMDLLTIFYLRPVYRAAHDVNLIDQFIKSLLAHNPTQILTLIGFESIGILIGIFVFRVKLYSSKYVHATTQILRAYADEIEFSLKAAGKATVWDLVRAVVNQIENR